MASVEVKRRLDRLLMLRPGEGRLVAWSFAYFFFLLCSYFTLRPLRESVAVATGVDQVQYLFSATFLGMLVMVPLFGWLVARFQRRVFLPLVYGFFIVNLLLFSVLLGGREPGFGESVVFFVWVSVFNLFVVSVFWSFMADLFYSEQGRRLFGIIAAGGSTGAITGPLLTAALAPLLGPFRMTLLAALLLSASLVCLLRLLRLRPEAGKREGGGRAIGGSIWGGALRVFSSPYLGLLAFVLLLTTLLQTVLYFQQIQLVGEHYGDTDPTRFFALVDAGASTVAVILQALVTGRLLSRLGAARTLVIMPLFTALGFVLLALAPGALLIGAIQALRRGGEYGLMKPARDLLYTRVDAESRYKSKNFIDTVVYRGGDISSSWLYTGLSSGLGLSLTAIAALAVPLAGGWAWLSHRLGRRFEERSEAA